MVGRGMNTSWVSHSVMKIGKDFIPCTGVYPYIQSRDKSACRVRVGGGCGGDRDELMKGMY